METKQIEEKRRIAALDSEYYSQIYQIKEEMRRTGKQFYTGSFCGHQLIVICTKNGMYAHTIIPCLTYIDEVTKI